MDKQTTDKIKDLLLQQVQLNNGMPILQPLDEELEKCIKGEG